MKKHPNCRSLAICAAMCIAAFGCAPASAQPAEDFYKGKSITLVISAGPGGGYATYILAVVKHMQKHIPGNPDFIRQHRQGAGGLVAASYLYTVARKDGTIIGTVHRGAVTTSALFKEPGANYDPAKFGWIGSVDKDVNLCVAWHEAPVKTFADAKNQQLIVGGIGPGSSTDTYPIVYNNLFGSKFKLVTGYNQGTAITLAMERGEVHGRCGWSWSSLVATRGDWLRDGKVNILLVGGLSRTPGIPDSVPMAHDFAATQEQKDILDLLLAPLELARPLLAPPGVPVDRLEILRTAFDSTMKDPAFLAEAKERGLDVDPLSGREVEILIANIFSKPQRIVDQAKDAVTRMDRVEITSLKETELNVTALLSDVKNEGRVIIFPAEGGALHEADISNSQTTVTIGGKPSKRAELKAGMTCAVRYGGDKATAAAVAC